MEDILASIRRILSEDEQPAAAATAPAAATEDTAPADDDVLRLDESMLVAAPEPEPEPREPEDERAALLESISAPGEPLEVAPAMPEPEPEPAPAPPPPPIPLATPVAAPVAPLATDRLIAPEAEASAASSMSSLMRTLDSNRQAGTQLYRGGPTLEDMVREEMRPMLKDWLDTNLPPLVERLVRAEIERMVGRAVG
jgi:cell pole-organizing protein PopZ